MFNEFVSVFAQKFLEIVLPVLATLLAGLVVAFITKVINEIKAKLTDQQLFYINTAVNTAILAAEQVNLKGELIDKKEYALSVAEAWLAEKGIKVDLHVLADLIEAAVYEKFNWGKEPEVKEVVG